MAFRFPLGTRVEAVQCIDGLIAEGDRGVIVRQLNHNAAIGWTGVAWDDFHKEMHDLGGDCEDGHGWNVWDRYLSPVYEADEILLNEGDLDEFLLC